MARPRATAFAVRVPCPWTSRTAAHSAPRTHARTGPSVSGCTAHQPKGVATKATWPAIDALRPAPAARSSPYVRSTHPAATSSAHTRSPAPRPNTPTNGASSHG